MKPLSNYIIIIDLWSRFKNIGRSNKKNSRYTITNVSMKDLSNIIKEFEKLPYKGYVRKRLKHEPADSYCIYQYILLSVLSDLMT